METRIVLPDPAELYPEVAIPYIDVHNLVNSSLDLVCPKDARLAPSNLLFNSTHGLGKTLLVAHIAKKIGERLGHRVPFIVYDCSEDTRDYHLRGSFSIMPDGTTAFVPGPFPLAIEMANQVGICVLCLEEVSALTPGAQKQCNCMTDWRNSIFVSQLGRNFRLLPGHHVVVIATMNPCFHPDTDCLTPYSVKRLVDLEEGELIYSFNQSTGEYEIDTVEKVWAVPCENGLVHVEGNTCDLLVTPNHSMFWKRQGVDQAWRKDPVGDIKHKRVDLPKPYMLPQTSDRTLDRIVFDNAWLSHKPGHTSMDIVAFCRLLGWYVADGSLYYDDEKQDYRVTITKYADTQPVRAEIEAFLDEQNIHCTSTPRDVRISDRALFHALEYYGGRYAHHKKVAAELLHRAPYKALLALFHAAYSCDGDGERAHGMRYSTASAELRNAMTFIANVLGYATSWGFDSGIHRIYLAEQRPASCPKSMTTVEYDGMVINVSVRKNHSLVAGRNGKFTAVGNSAYGGVYTLNSDLRSRFDEVRVPIPTMDQECHILREVCPFATANHVEKAAQLARDTRTDALEYQLSTRDLVHLLENISKTGDVPLACRMVADKFESDSDRDTVVDRINGSFATKLNKAKKSK